MLLLTALALACLSPSLWPGRAFVSIHSAQRRPLDAGLTLEALESARARGNFETGDQVIQVLPERRAFNEAIERGEWPLWWPQAGGGISLMGAPGAELLEPRAFL